MGTSDSPPTLEPSHEPVSSSRGCVESTGLPRDSGNASSEHQPQPAQPEQPTTASSLYSTAIPRPSRLKSLPPPSPDLIIHKPDQKLSPATFHLADSSSSSSSSSSSEADPDAMVYPSPNQLASLRKVPGKIHINTYLIAFVEFAERFSYYGTTVVFTNYIQRPLPEGSTTGAGGIQAGALGMGQQASTGITTFNSFWVYLCPLVGAYVADAHLGRYNTIVVSIFIALVGHTLLVISAIPAVIVHPNGSFACFIVAIIIMGIGTGGFKPNISPLVAEQAATDTQKPHIIVLPKSNEKVIVDPALTASRIYMYFYLMINVGALTGQIGMVYAEKYVGFWLAYLLPTLLFCTCPIVMILGKPLYVLRPPTGSVFGKAVKLMKLAVVKKLRAGQQAHQQPIAFWDAVKPSSLGSQKPAWMNFDDQWVDEVRRGVKACRVFLWFPIYWLTYNQMNNNLTSQAGVMNTHGLPNDILSNLDPFALIVLIPICDVLIYPALRKAGINFSPIKRITAGFITGAMAMGWAALTQHWIYQRSECGYRAGSPSCKPVDINVWVQTPSYILIALSEILASITGLEYAFALAPKNMRSLVTALFLFQSAIASAIGEAFNPLSADPLLVWNYGTMAVLAFAAGIAFYFVHRTIDAEHEQLVGLQEGTVSSGAKEVENKQIVIHNPDDHLQQQQEQQHEHIHDHHLDHNLVIGEHEIFKHP